MAERDISKLSQIYNFEMPLVVFNAKYYYKSCYFVKQKKMEAMKNVRGAHVFDLKLLKAFFYLVFGVYNKNSSNDILSRNEKVISVDSFSLVLLKENVDQRVTLATCCICYDICL